MAKIRHDDVIHAALELLDEHGLDALSTRRLAEKLGVKSATLYWHFRDKSALLTAMAAAVMTQHHTIGVPADTAYWPAWFADNARSFRRALVAHRDGARLHAGTTPSQDARANIIPKIAYLVRAGFAAHEAGMALLCASQFTIGCVLEEQAHYDEWNAGKGAYAAGATNVPLWTDGDVAVTPPDPERVFEFGLRLMVDGLRSRVAAQGSGSLTQDVRPY